MRKLFFLTIVVVLALSFSGVAAQGGYDGVDPSGVTLVYWHQYTRNHGETMEALVAEFNDTNEYGITVEPVLQGNYGEIRDQMNEREQVKSLFCGFGQISPTRDRVHPASAKPGADRHRRKEADP